MIEFNEKLYPDGSKYLGELANNLPHGFGRLHSSNGSIYIGEFNKGQIEGFGKYISHDDIRIGCFKNGYLNGLGLIEIKCQEPVSAYDHHLLKHQTLGEFDAGNLTGFFIEITKGRCIDDTDPRYRDYEELKIGMMHGGLQQGLGLIDFVGDGYEYLICGNFDNGQLNGIGAESSDGILSAGEFKDGKLHGIGITKKSKEVYYSGSDNLTNINNTYISAQFFDGVINGIGIEKETVDYMDNIERIKKIQVL